MARREVAHEEESMDSATRRVSQPTTLQADSQPGATQPTPKRRYRSAEERRCIVEETLVPGASVAKVARAHGVNANQVFAWRRMHLAGELRDRWSKPGLPSAAQSLLTAAGTSRVRLLPVSVSAEVEQSHPLVTVSGHGTDGASGSIELTLPKAQVRITGHVDAAVLRLVLESLRG